jgi:hypothetical protein
VNNTVNVWPDTAAGAALVLVVVAVRKRSTIRNAFRFWLPGALGKWRTDQLNDVPESKWQDIGGHPLPRTHTVYEPKHARPE